MSIYSLPDDIFKDKNLLDSDIVIYHYTSDKDTPKEKSVLTRNAFSLVMSGRKTMYFAEKTLHIHDSEIHILSAGNCIASVSIQKQKPFESVLLFFTNKVLLDFYTSHAELIEKLKRKKERSLEPYVAFQKDSFIDNYIQSVLLMLNGRSPLSGLMKQLKLQELLLYLMENQTEAFLSFEHTSGLSTPEMRMRKVVESNKFNNLTLDELAFLCNVSTSTFKRQFKKMYDCSPNAWLNGQRMILAASLLRDHSEKPGDIWFKLGFETHAGFTKSFKKHFGKLPKEFVK